MKNEFCEKLDYKRLFESAPGLYLVLDPDLHIIAASNAYCKATLTNRDAILGRHLFDVFPDNPDDPSADSIRNTRASLTRVLQSHQTDVMVIQRHDVRRPKSEGGGFEVRYWSPVNSPVLNPDGSLAYIIHRVENVTEFLLLKQEGIERVKLTDELWERAVRMEADLYSRSREVAETSLKLQLNATLEKQVAQRTALAESRSRQLQSLAVELIETEERERRKFAHLLHDDLQQMLAAAKMQLQAVSDINPNELALVDVGLILKESIEKSRRLSHELSPPVLLHSNLTGTLQWLGLRMDEQFNLKVALEVSVEPPLNNTPLKTFLFRSVQELLFNVVKHSGVNHARIILSGSQSDIAISVIDDGKGFDPGTLKEAKAGLGLITIRERASYIGGSLSIESAPDKGSRFTLTVPLIASDDEARKRQFLSAQPPNPALGGVAQEVTRVLFADDHHVMRQGLINLVNGQPHIEVVGEAANGQEALEQALHLRPDVVVMDISMPVMDGIEATRRIKAELPEMRVIGLSMHQDEQLIRIMRDVGAETLFLGL